jgi:hypothetical protein
MAYSACKKRKQLGAENTRNRKKYIGKYGPKTEQEHNHLKYCKNLLKMIYSNKVPGSIIRSRTLGYQYGDRPSSYFFNLEKGNQATKLIYKLNKEDGTTLDNKKDILADINSYYTKLYTQRNCYETASEDIKDALMRIHNHIKLSPDLMNSCEGLISKVLTEALKNTKKISWSRWFTI